MFCFGTDFFIYLCCSGTHYETCFPEGKHARFHGHYNKVIHNKLSDELQVLHYT